MTDSSSQSTTGFSIGSRGILWLTLILHCHAISFCMMQIWDTWKWSHVASASVAGRYGDRCCGVHSCMHGYSDTFGSSAFLHLNASRLTLSSCKGGKMLFPSLTPLTVYSHQFLTPFLMGDWDAASRLKLFRCILCSHLLPFARPPPEKQDQCTATIMALNRSLDNFHLSIHPHPDDHPFKSTRLKY